MNILLVINEQKDPEYVLANQVSELIGTRANLFIDGKHRGASVKNAKKISENEYACMDVILVFGGDGKRKAFAGIPRNAASQNPQLPDQHGAVEEAGAVRRLPGRLYVGAGRYGTLWTPEVFCCPNADI